MTNLNIEIPTSLHRAIKRKAFENNRTLKDEVIKVLKKYVGIDGGKK